MKEGKRGIGEIKRNAGWTVEWKLSERNIRKNEKRKKRKRITRGMKEKEWKENRRMRVENEKEKTET